MPTFFDALNELMAAEVPLVTITVVDTIGSVPQDRGAKAIVTADGLRFGTVGGGKVETKAIGDAQKMLRGEIAETTRFVQWNLNKDVGMTCGGMTTASVSLVTASLATTGRLPDDIFGLSGPAPSDRVTSVAVDDMKRNVVFEVH